MRGAHRPEAPAAARRLPPGAMRRAGRWLRQNLLGTPQSAVLSLLALWLLYVLVPPAVRWAFVDATFAGETREACTGGGACWVFVEQRMMQFIYGFYPAEERWRANLVFAGFALGLALLVWPRFRGKRLTGALLLTVFPVASFYLLTGGAETSQWGGLMLTLIISAVGIVLSLPLGILLALGRRSGMPVVSRLSVAFIELWRGVPLITVLFMASVMLPLFLPEGVNFDKLVRALVGVTAFASAYMAEVVRGGLQAIPRGQYEAAAALGLGYWRMMGLIILPQALHKVIPGIVNTFIGLFKDTSLVLVIGMFDLLGMVQSAATSPEWLGYAMEGYVFAGLVYWVFCFGMSRLSARISARGSL